LFKKTI